MQSHQEKYILYYINHQSINPLTSINHLTLTSINQTIGINDNMIQHCPLPKFKENLPRFLGNKNVTTSENLVAFSNVYHNIGANDNDTCMHLFVNSLEGKAVIDFFDLSPKI
jgi:hypothetical protein